MQKNKKFFLVAAFILILVVLALYQYRFITEIYYGITGKVVKEKASYSYEAIWSKKLSVDNALCLNVVPHPNCTFIRASINWDVPMEGTKGFDITCTYGCSK